MICKSHKPIIEKIACLNKDILQFHDKCRLKKAEKLNGNKKKWLEEQFPSIGDRLTTWLGKMRAS